MESFKYADTKHVINMYPAKTLNLQHPVSVLLNFYIVIFGHLQHLDKVKERLWSGLIEYNSICYFTHLFIKL